MKIQTFQRANWSAEILDTLGAYDCDGLELCSPSTEDRSPRVQALILLQSAIERLFEHRKCWVIAGHDVAQPNTRIVIHKKLWSSLNIDVSTALTDQVAEWATFGETGIQFFGAMDKELISNQELLFLWQRLQTCWVVAFKDRGNIQNIETVLAKGWGATLPTLPASLLRLISSEDAFLIQGFGPIEYEEGVIVIGKRGLVKELLDVLSEEGGI